VRGPASVNATDPVTITDGEENQSHEFNRAQIVELVKDKEAKGWSFAFLGAGLDAYAEAHRMGYDPRSVQSWAPDRTGAKIAFSSLSRAMASKRRKLASEAPLDKGDFFEGSKPAEDDRRRRKGGR